MIEPCLLLWKLNARSVTNAKIYAKIECVLHLFFFFFHERLSQGEIIARIFIDIFFNRTIYRDCTVK